MKKCPQCSRTYADETLSFCLEDGALLSPSYNPQETTAPTAAFHAPEAPTVYAAAREIPTVVNAGEIPTVVNSPRPTQQAQTEGVGWKIYLLGLLLSLIVQLSGVYLFYSYYYTATYDIFAAIASSLGNTDIGYIVAEAALKVPLNLFVFSPLAFCLGFIWSRGKWRWGIIALIPKCAFTLYYFAVNLNAGYHEPPYYISEILSHVLYIFAACLFAQIGSRLSRKPAA